MARILIVDDEGKMRALLAMALDAEGYDVDEAESGEAAVKKLVSFEPDVIITDIRMEGMSGLELLELVKAKAPGIECIVMTAFADAKSGIEAMRRGAVEYVAKPFEMDEMLLLVKNSCEKNTLKKQVAELQETVKKKYSLTTIVGSSKPLQELVRQVKIIAGKTTTVLILGKSGTGKELIARGIHSESGRNQFVAINCGALPDNLLESELFGHEKGSFTGAHALKKGLFEEAGSGSIFLDEIGDISSGLQVKLLRVLQEREFTRVGGTAAIRCEARVIAATNRNLKEAVTQGLFREDLYYRLSVFPLLVPSLADRIEDIPELVDAFCLKFQHTAGLASGVIERLMEYSWPGNIRELQNCIERAVIIAGGQVIEQEHLPEHIRQNRILNTPSVFTLPPEGISLDEVEKNLLIQALERSQGNKTQAAALLGVSRRAMYSKMRTHTIKGYGVDEDD